MGSFVRQFSSMKRLKPCTHVDSWRRYSHGLVVIYPNSTDEYHCSAWRRYRRIVLYLLSLTAGTAKCVKGKTIQVFTNTVTLLSNPPLCYILTYCDNLLHKEYYVNVVVFYCLSVNELGCNESIPDIPWNDLIIFMVTLTSMDLF